MMDEMMLEMYAGPMANLGDAAVAGSLSITDDGLRIDAANLINREEMGPKQLAALDAPATQLTTDQLFPDSTMVYAAGQHLDLFWEASKESLAGSESPEDVDEAMAMLADELGINPDTELFPLLDGEWAFGAVPSREGLLPEELDLNMAIVMLAQTSDPQSLAESLGILADSLDEQSVFVESESEGEMKTYTLRDYPDGPGMLSFGMHSDYAFISTGIEAVRNIFAGGSSLADNSDYQEAWDSFPRGMTPAYYLDLAGMMDAIRQGMDAPDAADFDEVVKYIKPVTVVAGAIESERDVTHNTAIVFITPAE
jgi:hypothetical protein